MKLLRAPNCCSTSILQPGTKNAHESLSHEKVGRKLRKARTENWVLAQLISNISEEPPPCSTPDAFAALTQQAPRIPRLSPSSAQLQSKTKMRTRSASRTVPSGTSPSDNYPLPAHSDRAMSNITQDAQDDASNTVTQPSSPAVRMHSPHPTHDQSASMVPAPVSLDFLAQYYRTGEYADLEIVSNGVERSVHKVIICSQSPVIKEKCSLVSPR